MADPWFLVAFFGAVNYRKELKLDRYFTILAKYFFFYFPYEDKGKNNRIHTLCTFADTLLLLVSFSSLK